MCLDADEELVIFSQNTFWTSLFVRHFLEVPDDTLRDDMLFYVRKSRAKSKSKTHQVRLLFVGCFYLVANCEIVIVVVVLSLTSVSTAE